MHDQRLTQLAEILVKKSVAVKPMEKVWIRVTDPSGAPLGREVFKQVVLAGGLPHFDLNIEGLSSWYFKNASEAQLKAAPDLYSFQVKHFDKSIVIVADQNTRDLVGVDSSKISMRAKLMEPYKKIMTDKPWVMTHYPTAAMAQDANMNLEELEEFYFQTTIQDWSGIEAQMKKLADALTDTEVEVFGEKTHLKLSTKGRKWIYDDWKANIPGGEVFTAPVDDSVEGEVYFNFPLTRDGMTMKDIHLTFKKGKVVKATASENEAFLYHILDTDAGSRRLGEFAIGGNPGVTKYMNDVLFDEKMMGTIHMALGFAYTDCGGVNQSAIHMDIIKDMHGAGSRVTANGKMILEEGQFKV